MRTGQVISGIPFRFLLFFCIEYQATNCLVMFEYLPTYVSRYAPNVVEISVSCTDVHVDGLPVDMGNAIDRIIIRRVYAGLPRVGDNDGVRTVR